MGFTCNVSDGHITYFRTHSSHITATGRQAISSGWKTTELKVRAPIKNNPIPSTGLSLILSKESEYLSLMSAVDVSLQSTTSMQNV